MRGNGGTLRVLGCLGAIASVAALLAACGSSSPAATTAPVASAPLATAGASPSAMSAFLDQANMVCASASETGDAVATPTISTGDITAPAASDLPEIATYFQSLVPIFTQLDTGLKALGKPPEMQEAWTQAMAVFDTTVGDFREALSSSQAGDLTAYKKAIAQEQTDNTTGSADFNNLGALVCGGGSGSAPTPTPG
ncbi:MAG TPA: hypothetical protein VI434_05540 [Candidatus Dormibacteraeota bacterium]